MPAVKHNSMLGQQLTNCPNVSRSGRSVNSGHIEHVRGNSTTWNLARCWPGTGDPTPGIGICQTDVRETWSDGLPT